MQSIGKKIHHGGLVLFVMLALVVGQMMPSLHAMPMPQENSDYAGEHGHKVMQQHEQVRLLASHDALAVNLMSHSETAPSETAPSETMSTVMAASSQAGQPCHDKQVSTASLSTVQDKRVSVHGTQTPLHASEATDCCGADCQCPIGTCVVNVALLETLSVFAIASASNTRGQAPVHAPSSSASPHFKPPKITLS